ncbi:MAG: hypothetical protein ACK5NG_05535 [Chthoniobacterales bacterium]
MIPPPQQGTPLSKSFPAIRRKWLAGAYALLMLLIVPGAGVAPAADAVENNEAVDAARWGDTNFSEAKVMLSSGPDAPKPSLGEGVLTLSMEGATGNGSASVFRTHPEGNPFPDNYVYTTRVRIQQFAGENDYPVPANQSSVHIAALTGNEKLWIRIAPNELYILGKDSATGEFVEVETEKDAWWTWQFEVTRKDAQSTVRIFRRAKDSDPWIPVGNKAGYSLPNTTGNHVIQEFPGGWISCIGLNQPDGVFTQGILQQEYFLIGEETSAP